ncbi:MAG TPA: TetR family transcriptional regulator [Bryobacteraceae bacterium]|jgi:AcrR family transcriptional regulator|nr:TetR family transcriptional regulator [Bryobacteraceae bacterium]
MSNTPQRVPDTKERILDAAEKLFGQNGFTATSLRDITAEAGVNLAAVNYHFQTKESLFEAAIARRMEPVNRRRIELLDAAGANPTLEQILLAFLSPLFVRHPNEAIGLMSQILATPDSFVRQLFKKHLAGVVNRFVEALQQALPNLTRTEILWRLHFTAGSMAHLMARGSVLPEISEGLCNPSDRPAVLARLVTFAAAGFRADAWGGDAGLGGEAA